MKRRRHTPEQIIRKLRRAYAQADRDGRFPPDFATLVSLNLATGMQFVCPSARIGPGVKEGLKTTANPRRDPSIDPKVSDFEACYLYIGGQTLMDDPENLLIVERAHNHDGAGVHVVYLAGDRVDFIVDAARVEGLLRDTIRRIEARGGKVPRVSFQSGASGKTGNSGD